MKRPLFLVLFAGAVGAFLKLFVLGTLPSSSDYQDYIETAKFFSGQTGALQLPFEILKPLNPMLVALLGFIVGIPHAFILQSTLFYFALIVAMYLLAREFFEGDFIAGTAGVLMASSYPVLKYGLDIYADAGAWFFYVISLWLTLTFLKNPSRNVLFWNIAVITLGFLWKEYSIVAAIIFGLTLLVHPVLSIRKKAAAIAWFAGVFLVVNLLWQGVVWELYHYTYLDWYHSGGTPGFATQWTPNNVIKSFAALLGLLWLAVPVGLYKVRRLNERQKVFLLCAVPPPFIALLWGFVSSRLFFVIAVPFMLLGFFGLDAVTHKNRLMFSVCTALIVIANLAWLFLSYAVAV
jgi:hypothetical protein